jgi:hypothetical protein
MPAKTAIKRKKETKRKGKNPVTAMKFSPRVIVKLHDDVKGATDEERESLQKERYEKMEVEPEKYLGPSWSAFAKDFGGINIKRLITSVDPGRIRQLVKKAESMDPTYRPPNPLTYFAVQCPSREIAEAVAKTLPSRCAAVQGTYLQSGCALPLGVVLSRNEGATQGYLNAASDNGKPAGIDAK